MEIIAGNLKELKSVAKQLLTWAGKKKKWLFSGEIGSGKTTLIKVICKELGVSDPVTSPSYSLVNEYSYKDKVSGQEKLIYHIDLYRLKSVEEAVHIGINEYLYNEQFCFIEWPELIEDLWPEDSVKISLKIIENSSRKILFL